MSACRAIVALSAHLLVSACVMAPAAPTATPTAEPTAPPTPSPTATATPETSAPPTPTATLPPHLSPSVDPRANPPPTSSPPAVTANFELTDQAPPGALPLVMTDNPSGILGPRFLPPSLTAEAGEIVLFLQNVPNDTNNPHNFALGRTLEEYVVNSPIVGANRSAVLAINGLEPGDYVFWCSFAGHYRAGMTGTLTVE